ncbi:MAG: hypothetical protein AAFW82_07045, partial [Pseudomonadota bacterium]
TTLTLLHLDEPSCEPLLVGSQLQGSTQKTTAARIFLIPGAHSGVSGMKTLTLGKGRLDRISGHYYTPVKDH